jgi:hypothetical protein
MAEEEKGKLIASCVLAVIGTAMRLAPFIPIYPHGHRVAQTISALARGRTLIIIAHRLPTITAADQILVIDQGQVVDPGH